MQVRMLSARGSYGYPPSFPPRPADVRLPLSGGFQAASPPRKVVTDFAAFGAKSSSSVYGTAVQPTPFSLAGNKAAFGSIRATAQNNIDDDEEDEEEQSGRQRVVLREDSITLDQVRSEGFRRCFLSRKSLLIGSCLSWQRERVGSSYRHTERMAWYPRVVCPLDTFLGGCQSVSHCSPLSQLYVAFLSLTKNCINSVDS